MSALKQISNPLISQGCMYARQPIHIRDSIRALIEIMLCL